MYTVKTFVTLAIWWKRHVVCIIFINKNRFVWFIHQQFTWLTSVVNIKVAPSITTPWNSVSSQQKITLLEYKAWSLWSNYKSKRGKYAMCNENNVYDFQIFNTVDMNKSLRQIIYGRCFKILALSTLFWLLS